MTNYCLKIIKYTLFIFLIFSTISCNYFNRGLGFDYIKDDNDKTSCALEKKENDKSKTDNLKTDNKNSIINFKNNKNTSIKNISEKQNNENKNDKPKTDNTEKQKQNKTNNFAKYKNFGIIISGPSGVGKTSIVHKFIEKNKETVNVSISATTRKRRNNEIDTKDYYFITKDKFNEILLKNEFLEYDNKYDNYYGTPKRNYFDAIDSGKDIIFILSIEGMINAKKYQNTDFITVFIVPPSYEELKRRLMNRKTETITQIAKRLSQANQEMQKANNKYDYIIYNYDLDDTVSLLNAIYLAEQRKREI